MLIGKKRKKNKNVKKSRNTRSQRKLKDPEKPKKPQNKKLKIKLNILFCSLAIVPICIYLLSRYTYTTSLLIDVTKMNKEIEKLQDQKGELQLELEEIKDSGWIEEQAKIRMNMRKAKSDQIVLIDVK